MILYYSPGACSLADHIALEEAGLKFDAEQVDLKTHKLQDGTSYYEVNPKGYVPALRLDDGKVITENIAILSYIADQAPALIPQGPLGRYSLLEMLGFISTELHKSFSPLFRNPSEADRKAAVDKITARLDYIAKEVQGPYLFGKSATVADAYLFLMLLWAGKFGIPVPKSLQTLADHMRSRPTVQAALKREHLA
jgi:glutathione S-transferase